MSICLRISINNSNICNYVRHICKAISCGRDSSENFVPEKHARNEILQGEQSVYSSTVAVLKQQRKTDCF